MRSNFASMLNRFYFNRLFFCCISLLFFGPVAFSADVIDGFSLSLSHSAANTSSQGTLVKSPASVPDQLRQLFQIDDLELVAQRNEQSIFTTYHQYHRGVAVTGGVVAVSVDASGTINRVYGQLIRGIDSDLSESIGLKAAQKTSVNAASYTLNPEQIAMQYLRSLNELGVWTISQLQAQPTIRLINGRALSVTALSFYGENQDADQYTKPLLLIDASGLIIETHEQLTFASASGFTRQAGAGSGGNSKVGERFYRYKTLGENETALSANTFIIQRDASSKRCYLEADGVATISAHNDLEADTVYEYQCESIDSPNLEPNEINQTTAYSPLSDAHFHGQVAYQVFSQFPFSSGGPLKNDKTIKIKAHYGKQDIAFWNGEFIGLGDGLTYFYPQVSADIVGHEMAHAFLRTYSDISQIGGVTGGIEESFADIAGEAVEYTLNQTRDKNATNDWQFAAEAYAKAEAARYFDDPTKDQNSIGSARHVRPYLTRYNLGGVFNKAFYHLITDNADWDPVMGLELFALSSIECWKGTLTYQSAAQCVVDTASELNKNNSNTGLLSIDREKRVLAVVSAFAKVDVITEASAGTNALFDYSNQYTTVTFKNVSQDRTGGENDNKSTTWLWAFGDGEISHDKNPVHRYTNKGQYEVSLTMTPKMGDPYVYKKQVIAEPHYCPLKGNSYQNYITQVGINSTQYQASGASDYSDFTDQTPAALAINRSNTLSLTQQVNSDSDAWGWSVFIDFNGDGDFYDSNELVLEKSNATNVQASVHIPDAPVGESTRMRVALKRGNPETTPCVDIANGEYEDYWVTFVDEDPEEVPEVAFSYQQTGAQVTFVNTTNPMPENANWRWDLGDGTVRTERDVTHTYPLPALGQSVEYSVSLSLDGMAVPAVQKVTITNEAQPDPVLDFSYTTEYGADGAQVQFTNTSRNAPSNAQWQWDFGDNRTSSEANPSHVFALSPTNGGTQTYDVRLSLNGSSLTKVVAVTVTTPEPRVEFSYRIDDRTVQFSNTSVFYPEGSQWQWHFGDGRTSTEKNPQHKYQGEATRFTVQLTLSYNQKTVQIEKAIALDVDTAPVTYCETGATSTDYGWITGVRLWDENDTALIDHQAWQNDGYTLYPETEYFAAMSAGQSYRYQLDVSLSGEKNVAGQLYASAWLDANRNGEFEEAELLFSQSLPNAESVTGTYTLPESAVIGKTRLRFSINETSAPEPCEVLETDYPSGEKEDYFVTLENSQRQSNDGGNESPTDKKSGSLGTVFLILSIWIFLMRFKNLKLNGF